MGMKCRLVAPESGTGTQFELNPTSTLLVCTSKSHPRWLSGQVNSKVLPSTMPTVMLVLVGGSVPPATRRTPSVARVLVSQLRPGPGSGTIAANCPL